LGEQLVKINKKKNMSKIIVTGGLGFIGSHFVNYLNENTDHEVLIVDKLTYAASRENIKHPTPQLIKDICNVTVDDLGDYDYIVHFAAESHVDNSIKDGMPFVKTNVEGTFNLIEVARKNPNLKKFLHISTDEVYGDMAEHFSLNHSATEKESLNPSSYYSATKTSSDLLVMSAGRTYNFPYLITRTCNNYGENQHKEKFVPKIIHSIKNGLEVPVYGDGKQVREWIHADDNAAAIYKLLISDKVQEIYNIGTAERYQNVDILKMIGNHLEKEVNFKYVTDRLGHDRRYSLNCTKFKQEFGDIQTIRFSEWITKIL
jgi:dTDP-glucose 4,6-dehydratase